MFVVKLLSVLVSVGELGFNVDSDNDDNSEEDRHLIDRVLHPSVISSVSSLIPSLVM